MDASRPIAWAIGLVVVAVVIAALGGPAALAAQVVRFVVELPTVGTHLGELVSETKLIGWDIFSFVMLLVLLWGKLR